MRAYRTFEVNLGPSVLFKNTLPMVETFLRENGVRYEGLLFRFGICPDKLLAAYPQLEQYRVESPSGVLYSNASPTGVFRKVPLGWELPTADQPLIREIASKVPRVYNIAFVEISLEGVGWMGTPPCLCKPLSRWDGEETQFRTSRIELKKDFDYGNRYNPLRFVFDVTNETSLGEPLDVSGWRQAITDRFGAIAGDRLEYIPDTEESRQWRQTAVAVDEEFRELNRELDAMSFPADPDSFTPRREWLDQMPPMSLKRVLQAVFKGTGWRYISGRDGVHRMNKTLPGGHRMELELDRGPQFKRVSGSLLIRGFSFLHTFHIPSYTPRDPEQMEHYVRCVREWADYVERHAAPRLLEVYGPTPDWVVYPD